MDRINRMIERRSWAFLRCGCLWRSFIPSVNIEVMISEKEMNRSDEYQHYRGDDYCF